MRRILSLLPVMMVCLLASCYQQRQQTSDAWILTDRQVDSISFYSTHHYTQNFNFLVKADSLYLIVQHPAEVLSGLLVDTVYVYHGERLVVADITKMPVDSVDSVWVKVARDQQTIGWIHEADMLAHVAPASPISRFIDYFSDTHILMLLTILSVGVASYLLMFLLRRRARIVHFNDIDSFYPTLLAMLVAAAAVFYSTIQLYAPDSWRHYYYHPTLNPFSVPLHLGMFLLTVWAMVIVALATFYDVRSRLSFSDSVIYFLGLMGVCALNYVLFSVSTLYYIGYPLLVVYMLFALWRYFAFSHHRYVCGACGNLLRHKGVCPHCGAFNE